MSLVLQKQIDRLKEDRDELRGLVSKLMARQAKHDIFEGWVRREMHNGMTNLATITVEKILQEGLEAVVSPAPSSDVDSDLRRVFDGLSKV